MTDPRLYPLAAIGGLLVASSNLKIGLVWVLSLAWLLTQGQTRALWALAKILLGPVVFFGLIVLISSDWSEAGTSTLRFAFVSALPAMYLVACGTDGLVRVLTWLRLPPLAVLVFSAACQFVVVLGDVIRQVREAQIVRGIPLDQPARAWYYLPALVIPVLIACFKLADQLAISLITRGAAQAKRSAKTGRSWRRVDSLVLVGLIVVVSAIYLVPW